MPGFKAVEFGPDTASVIAATSINDVSPAEHLRAVAFLGDLSGKRFLNSDTAVGAILGDAAELTTDLARALTSQLHTVSVPSPDLPTPFPVEAIGRLGVYVYALVDPRSARPFYIGKGRGNRVYQHVWAALGKEMPSTSGPSDAVGASDSTQVTSAKNARITEIFKAGFGVEHWIIRHDIAVGESDDKAAFAAEQCLLDFARLDQLELVNLQGGHVATEHGMMRAEELARRFSAELVPALPEPCALIKVNAAAAPDAEPEDIYAWSREAWIVSEAARNIPSLPILVFADDIVRAVHRAESWELASQSRKKRGSNRRTRWWRYTGPVDTELERRYVGKSLREVRALRPTGGWQQHGWHPYLTTGEAVMLATDEDEA